MKTVSELQSADDIISPEPEFSVLECKFMDFYPSIFDIEKHVTKIFQIIFSKKRRFMTLI